MALAKSGSNLPFKSLTAGTGITLTSAASELQISSDSGEVNTSSNSGAGEGLALAKSGSNLPFKSITAGTGITLTSSASELQINSAGGTDTNLATNDLTQVDLNRVYTRSATAGVSRLRFQGVSQVLTLEDAMKLELYAGKYDDASFNKAIELSISGATGNIKFSNGKTLIEGANTDLNLYGQFATGLQSKIQLGANINIEAKVNRTLTLKTGTLYFDNTAGLVGSVKSDVFIWGSSYNAIGSEGFSVQKDMLVKGSDNAAATSGFKVTDVNNNLILDIKNNKTIGVGGAVNADLALNITGTTNDATKGTLRCNDLAGNKMFSVDNAGNIEAPTTGLVNFGGAVIVGSTGLFKLAVKSNLPLVLRDANDSKLVSFANDGNRYTTNTTFGADSAPTARVDIRGYDNSAATSSLKVTSLNNNSLLDVRNNGALKLQYLPSLPAGTVAGDVWSQNGTLKIGNPTANIQTEVSASTITPNIDTTKLIVTSALAAALTIAAPTGTPHEGQELTFRFKDDGTARALTWNAIFEDYTGSLPTTTTAGKTVYIGCKYNLINTKWDVVAVQTQP